ncbi:MAG: caspase family protein [Pseudomonadota bacterium]
MKNVVATCLIAMMILCVSAVSALASRIALVIGNSDYEIAGVLKNPVNDAKAMAEKLRGLGFETVEGYDLDKDGLNDTLDVFSEKVLGAETAIFYYAGHGISVDGVNYLVPVDAVLNHPVRWKRAMVPLNDIMETLSYSSGPNLLFLDACRDNPLADMLNSTMGNLNRSVATERGLSRIEPGDSSSGTAIAFATSPGHVAQDGEGSHSPFTSALLNHIGAPNTSIADVMIRVTGEVKEKTSGQQEPWINMSLTEPVFLNKVEQVVASVEPQAAPAPSASDDLSTQMFMYEAAQTSGDINDFRAYVEAYPNGKFVSLARNAIARLEAEAPQVASVAPEVVQGGQTALLNQPMATRTLGGEFRLAVTPAVAQAEASQQTEIAMGLSKEHRRSIQQRLNAIGINVGGADGDLGPRSRAGIRTWQTQNGLYATGYLNELQHQMLVANSETALTAYLASAPKAKTTTRTKTKSKSGAARASDAVNSFFQGLGQGIGSNIGR